MQPYTVSLLHMNLKVRIFKDAVRLSGKQHALCLQLPTILQLQDLPPPLPPPVTLPACSLNANPCVPAVVLLYFVLQD